MYDKVSKYTHYHPTIRSSLNSITTISTPNIVPFLISKLYYKNYFSFNLDSNLYSKKLIFHISLSHNSFSTYYICTHSNFKKMFIKYAHQYLKIQLLNTLKREHVLHMQKDFITKAKIVYASEDCYNVGSHRKR